MNRTDILQTVSLSLDERPRKTPRIKKRESLIKSLLLTPLLNRRRTWGGREQPLTNECLEEFDEEQCEIFKLEPEEDKNSMVLHSSSSIPLRESTTTTGRSILTTSSLLTRRNSATSTNSDVTYSKMTSLPSPDQTKHQVQTPPQTPTPNRRVSGLFSSPFSSPFKKKADDEQDTSWQNRELSREEAWQLYLMKMEEESNYLKCDEDQEEICSCPQCIASYESLYSEYLGRDSIEGRCPDPAAAYDEIYESCTTEIMNDIMDSNSTNCSIM